MDLVKRLRDAAIYEEQFKTAPKWNTSLNKKQYDLVTDAANEIERLYTDNAELRGAYYDETEGITATLRNDFLDQIKEDAARYRWLRSRPKDDCTAPRIEVNQWTCNANDEGVLDSVNEGEVLSGDELDAAIDAAIHSDLTK